MWEDAVASTEEWQHGRNDTPRGTLGDPPRERRWLDDNQRACRRGCATRDIQEARRLGGLCLFDPRPHAELPSLRARRLPRARPRHRSSRGSTDSLGDCPCEAHEGRNEKGAFAIAAAVSGGGAAARTSRRQIELRENWHGHRSGIAWPMRSTRRSRLCRGDRPSAQAPAPDAFGLVKAERSLASRDIRTHFESGKTGSSTLRRSLAALLGDHLKLSRCRETRQSPVTSPTTDWNQTAMIDSPNGWLGGWPWPSGPRPPRSCSTGLSQWSSRRCSRPSILRR